MKKIPGQITGEKGFTLVESLLVLLIIAILTAIIIPISNRWVMEKEEEQAISALVAAIYAVQSYSMAHEVYTKLVFSRSDGRTFYTAAAIDNRQLFRQELPEGMSISGSSNLKMIEFHGNGDVFNFGKLIIIGKSGKTTITFQFQRGRMIISESKRIFLARSNPNTRSPYDRFWHIASIRNENDDQTAS